MRRESPEVMTGAMIAMLRTASSAWKSVIVGLVALGCLVCLSAQAADHPLSKDDVTLLLLGGSSADKMVTLIKQRGIDFQMTAELAEKFRRDGATDPVIDALQKAGDKLAAGQKDATPRPARPAPSAPTANP